MAARKPISMREIAELAGVSIATVSRVINNNGRFSEETRQRVQRIIDENGYIANQAAKGLREQRTRTIGMIVPDITNDFFSTLALQAEQDFAREGYSVFICNDANDEARENDYLRTLASKRVDGILFISGSSSFDEAQIPSSIPIVCIDRYPERSYDIPRIISEDLRGGFLATEHLIAHGCERIMFLTNKHHVITLQNRQAGYERALAYHGLPVEEELLVTLPRTSESLGEARQAVADFVASGRRLDGIFAVNDILAVGAGAVRTPVVAA